MKRCPICGAHAVEEAGTCFQCLYHFDTLSTEDVCKLTTPLSPPVRTGNRPVAHVDPTCLCPNSPLASHPFGAPPVATSVAVLERPAPVVTPVAAPIATPSPILIPAPSPARSFTVELRFGTTAPHTIKTHKGSLYIGRATFNDLVIDEECIMRRHAHIYRLEQGVFMELLSSGATATINGGAANHISLICDGDVIGLGPCDAIIHC